MGFRDKRINPRKFSVPYVMAVNCTKLNTLTLIGYINAVFLSLTEIFCLAMT